MVTIHTLSGEPVVAPAGKLAAAFLMTGRILQGLSGACIMAASLALLKAYWSGAARQQAVSLWSMGSWGGSGFAALFGARMAGTVGWRWIFFAAAALSLVGMLMVAGTPESKTESKEPYKFDTAGVITVMIMMVSLPVVATQGGNFGWTSLPTLGLLAASIVFGILFVRIESGNPHGFVDFTLFRNMTYTVLRNVRELTRANAEGFGCTFEIRQGVPGAVLVDDKEETLRAAEIARTAFGDADVIYPGPAFPGSEDFAFMLQEKRGTYCFIGNGDTPMVHHPQFVFDQSILTKGGAFWVALAEGYLQ